MVEDVVVHDAVHGELRGRDEVREVVTAVQRAFPDLELQIEAQVGEGDTVVTRYSITGTHDGEILGASPSGRRATLTGIDISRFSASQIVEVWETWDALRLVHQLGLSRRWRGFVAPKRRPSRGPVGARGTTTTSA
jgi:predicted ester cyclase